MTRKKVWRNYFTGSKGPKPQVLLSSIGKKDDLVVYYLHLHPN